MKDTPRLDPENRKAVAHGDEPVDGHEHRLSINGNPASEFFGCQPYYRCGAVVTVTFPVISDVNQSFFSSEVNLVRNPSSDDVFRFTFTMPDCDVEITTQTSGSMLSTSMPAFDLGSEAPVAGMMDMMGVSGTNGMRTP